MVGHRLEIPVSLILCLKDALEESERSTTVHSGAACQINLFLKRQDC